MTRPAPITQPSRLMALLRRLRRSATGSSTIEFALVLPILTTMGMYGVELANMAVIDMQVSQMATAVADNASRLQQTNNNVVAPTLTESDVDSVMVGAAQQGRRFRFADRGRIILSSVERDPVSGKPFIHWQRCTGRGNGRSAYGDDRTNNGRNGGDLPPIGKGQKKITAPTGTAVMLAEVEYDYDGVFGDMFVQNVTFRQEAAFMVRDVRDLRGPDQPGITGGGGQSACT
ncbi:TadE/TadG family type IV pilus assembly protein [Novosphingobium sp.]|uniref:TadE/TadG family type IV pilus assembly protein n=1 Tax=Novosphingobium sp. TaxID=1874826 RepID=UPI00273263EE|nr:TadE family protein [Novosphingobium sp.]MDP3906616.1 pilus assembly protein [Novosphingobium sp.]